MNQHHVAQALNFIRGCSDKAKLRTMTKNADIANVPEVAKAARMRVYEVSPAAEPRTFQRDVWACTHALEDALTVERKKTTQLNRTRQKISRDGEHRTVVDLVNGKKSSGFDMMIERDMPQYTFEAVTMRHPDIFKDQCIASASVRLAAAKR